MGGLATAARMVAGGARVLVLEKYTIPGGSAAYFQRDGYTFDVGSSMMFGLGDRGTTNLLTECLRTVGKSVETVLDPTQLHYHLPRSERHPQGLDVKVWNSYEAFVAELTSRFPHEAAGIRSFYGDAWKVFNALNAMDLKSLEEPRYLIEQLFKSPRGCLSLLGWLPANTGDIARKYISDPELLRFIDAECYIFSTVAACATPMVTSGMVFSDRHYGGIRYPKGGVGTLARKLAEGIEQAGGAILYRANATCVLFDEAGAAAGVRLSDGREFRSRAVVSNATRWDTFGRLLGGREPPEAEKLFLSRYKKSPSFFSMHLGIRADVLPPGTECHHVVVDDWDKMEEARHTLFISIPSLLDPSLAPDGHHTVHAFTPDWIDAWEGLSPEEYAREKDALCASLLRRMDARFPGISSAVTFKEVGTPRTHRRFLGRPDGTYGPIPSRNPLGIITMPFNTTDVPGLYCVGDSTFPGQGVNAVVFSGFGCAHRALCDLGLEKSWPLVDSGYRALIRAARMAAQKMGPKDGEQEPAEVTRSGAPLGTGARPPVPVTNNIITFAHQPAHVQQQQQQ
uniref:prolycopene isomerase n=1 Tax=Chlamydomonas euryale TaxID=1486919 RepID=A0A7R9YTZ1_9CHLO